MNLFIYVFAGHLAIYLIYGTLLSPNMKNEILFTQMYYYSLYHSNVLLFTYINVKLVKKIPKGT